MNRLPLLRSIIISDDIRREISGKEILIGVYSGGIRFFGPSPQKLRYVSIRFEFDADPNEFRGTLNFQVVAPSGVPIINVSPEIALNKTGRTIYVLTHQDLVFYEQGIYVLKVGLSSEPEEVDAVEVTFGTQVSEASPH